MLKCSSAQVFFLKNAMWNFASKWKYLFVQERGRHFQLSRCRTIFIANLLLYISGCDKKGFIEGRETIPCRRYIVMQNLINFLCSIKKRTFFAFYFEKILKKFCAIYMYMNLFTIHNWILFIFLKYFIFIF